MNEIILQLLNEISALKPPMTLKELLDKTPLDMGKPSTEFAEHFNLLVRLKQLTDEQFKYNSQLTELELKIKNHTDLTQQIEAYQYQIQELQNNIKQLKSKLVPIYNELEIKANEFALAADPLAVIDTKNGDDMQKKIAEFSIKLTSTCTDIDTRLAKAKLVINKNKFDAIASELLGLDIHCTQELSTQRLQGMIDTVSSEKELFTSMQRKALVYQKQFSEQLSNDHLPIRIGELKQESKELSELQNEIERKIAENPLDLTIKERLTQEFTSSSDTHVLINSYRNKLDGILSYIDPIAWTSWGLNYITNQDGNKKHDEEQQTISRSVAFLELLTQKHELEIKQHNIEKSVAALNTEKDKTPIPIIATEPGTQNTDATQLHDPATTSDIKLDPTQLIAETLQLLFNLPSYSATMDLNEDSPEMHFLETLILNIPVISNTLEKKSTALNKLNELLLILTEINTLRAEYNLMPDQDNLLPSLQDASNEEHTFSAQTELKAKYQELINSCKSYLHDTMEYDKLADQLIQVIDSQKHLKAQLVKPPKPRVLETISNHLKILNETINLKLRQLAQLPMPTLAIPNTEELPEVDSEPVDTSKLNEEVPTHLELKQPAVSSDLSSISPLVTLEAQQKLIETPLSEPQHQKTDQLVQALQYPELDTDEVEHDSSSYSSYSTEDSESSSHSDEDQDYIELSSESDHSLQDNDPVQLSIVESEVPPSSNPDRSTYFSTEPSVIETTDLLIHSTDAFEHNPEPTEHLLPTQHQIIAPKPIAPIDNVADNLEHLFGTKNSSTLLLTEPTITAQSSPSSEHELTTPSTSEDTSNSDDDSLNDEQDSSTPQKQNLLNTVKWHHEIVGYLNKFPADIQNWYTEVYNKLRKELSSELYCYKAAHIVRDILFEIEHKDNSDVIRAYMRLCPKPTQDIGPLLALKPSLLITDEPYNEADTMMDCPKELKKHYEHYATLKKEHPIEAELFLQAVRSVHMVQLYAKLPNRTITAEQIPSLATDPRYEPLKRHRGFIKVWEFLEDLCRLILGKIQNQPEYEYSKRPCLFNTKSHRLIKEADGLIHDLLPMNTP
ncbi:hypothetical protein [Legionella bononiensis]|uniref:Interaptin n=1 Tax=Legionella bononiensis TaxID=2793102 RepID=A0ABS1WG72_9GAMM|nr:hypothetical protein [Legionella bononiensis]MBL7481806.1 hypothetical protein [Legionella bononiensis]MBL7528355.1 hypothetical protein [Legionella bononiensis]MBL7564318.1 hypothetical protein [Legionella bononiensis]